ncbi:MAG: indolepyruvate ferredoxin oxidoreductase family protein [Alphaproteobacteria bacterium]|nr:indolepyruvate ferredoxin oxidoreductase family protein [Alphaproteobacteria bacterium]
MALAAVSLDDKYTLEHGQVFMTGTQALVRLPMLQHARDRAAGLNTACYISGYRGSPLGNLDRALVQIKTHLKAHNIHFQPGVNEDLAATAAWGSQQLRLFPGAKHDGVFALWYGKGPGVDRSMDALKHANNAGTAAYGGVLALAGDDHVCASSTLPHQSEFDFMAANIPVLNPAGVQEFLDFGLYGYALSRFSGLWVGFICVAETVDSSAIVSLDPDRVTIRLPDDYVMPEGGLNIRWPDTPLEQERRLHEHKMGAALAFVRANGLDRTVIDGPARRIGLVTTGKSYLDVRQALDLLGLDESGAAALGLSLYKVGMSWPLEPEGAMAFASGLEELVVVEEKRSLLETQLKDILYSLPTGQRPRIVGKEGANGQTLFPISHELNPVMIARAIAARLPRVPEADAARQRLAVIEAEEESRAAQSGGKRIERVPYFCAGCPHNTSTKVPAGSRAFAGIGCHYMAQWMDRETETYTQMGAEGATWLGQAPFTETRHIFQNLGDGTYFHSGLLAIRAAIAAKVNMTYKILFNDAVAMTGGQPMDGPLNVAMITNQLRAEGIKRIAVVTDEPEKYPVDHGFADDTTVHHRDDLDAVQRALREIEGVSALVYDQMCATEKRRKRKRGTLDDPPWRVVINPDVCEGCGDCSYQSNCLAVVPLETELGRKRAIDQSACNKDFSCIKGFCPSFVLVKDGQLKKSRHAQSDDFAARIAALPEPTKPLLAEPYGIVIAGVGGMGTVTIGTLLGIAARLENKGATVIDKIGLAQKFGAVTCHVRLATTQNALHAPRIASGGASLLLGADLLTAATPDVIARFGVSRSHAIINSHEAVTGDFTRNPDLTLPGSELHQVIEGAIGRGRADFLDLTRMATALLGDAIMTNPLLLGLAYQKGFIPLSAEAIERAMELNEVAVETNQRAFRWGRLTVHDPDYVSRALGAVAGGMAPEIARTLDEVVAFRAKELTVYQNAAYAQRYRSFVERVRAAETARTPGFTGLADTVARAYHKLLAYKDEYEVARLYTDGRFAKQIAGQFEGRFKLLFNLAPPLIASRDPVTGHLKKRVFGPWMGLVFHLMARLKGLRGTPLDVFGYTAERRMERRLIGEYETIVERLLATLEPEKHALAVEIAKLPLEMRGFGHIKEANVARAKLEEARLIALYEQPTFHASAAE